MELAHIKEFSRHAHTYDEHTSVQKEVAYYLLSPITSEPKCILDLGCGSGEIYKNLTWEYDSFDGVDSSAQMLALHPRSPSVRLIPENFESPALAQQLLPCYDLIISSSALQWAHSIESMVSFCASTCKEGAFAVFTNKTFETIYQLSGLPVFLPHAQTLGKVFEHYFTCKQEIRSFKLYFDDNISKFRYIKQSGVSGKKKQLSIAQTKALIHNYPHTYLEFEVLFVWGVPKKAKL